LQDKLFMFADEAFWAGDKTSERTLKGLVTERVMMIEPKGVNAFQWPNRLALYMAANEGWVVPASHDERRYAISGVSGNRNKTEHTLGRCLPNWPTAEQRRCCGICNAWTSKAGIHETPFRKPKNSDNRNCCR
jgi:hypothetical protein